MKYSGKSLVLSQWCQVSLYVWGGSRVLITSPVGAENHCLALSLLPVQITKSPAFHLPAPGQTERIGFWKENISHGLQGRSLNFGWEIDLKLKPTRKV